MQLEEAIPTVDGLIKEYLLFRGYKSTYEALQKDLKNDKSYRLRVDQIVDKLFQHLRNSDLDGLDSFWRTLEERLFVRLTGFKDTIKYLDLAIKRCFLVVAFRHKRMERIEEFFKKYGLEFTRPEKYQEWSLWFTLPYQKSPERHPQFESYFTKRWMETLTLSLRNFLVTAFRVIPRPGLLKFDKIYAERQADRQRIQGLQHELKNMQKEKNALQIELENARSRPSLPAPSARFRALTAPTIGDVDEKTQPPGASSRGPAAHGTHFVFDDDTISTASLSPSCEYLAVATKKYIKLWHVADAPVRLTPISLKSRTLFLDWLPASTGTQLIIVTALKTYIWEVTNVPSGSKEMWSFIMPAGGRALAMAVAKDILVFSNEQGLFAWDTRKHSRMAHERSDDYITSLVFNHNGHLLIGGSSGGCIRIMDPSLKVLEEFQAHDEAIVSVALLADGETIVSGGRDLKIYQWHLSKAAKNTTRECLRTFELDLPPQVQLGPFRLKTQIRRILRKSFAKFSDRANKTMGLPQWVNYIKAIHGGPTWAENSAKNILTEAGTKKMDLEAFYEFYRRLAQERPDALENDLKHLARDVVIRQPYAGNFWDSTGELIIQVGTEHILTAFLKMEGATAIHFYAERAQQRTPSAAPRQTMKLPALGNDIKSMEWYPSQRTCLLAGEHVVRLFDVEAAKPLGALWERS